MTVQALRRGRPEVLADLLDRYGRDMQAVAYLIVRDRAAAEDIVADSLLAALDHGRSLRDDDALRPWLLRIATNKALRYRQRAAHVVDLQVVEGAALLPRLAGGDGGGGAWGQPEHHQDPTEVGPHAPADSPRRRTDARRGGATCLSSTTPPSNVASAGS